MAAAQRPIELIQARSLIATLSTAAFLVDEKGTLLYYNAAAAELLGVRFEDAGEMPAEAPASAHGSLVDTSSRWTSSRSRSRFARESPATPSWRSRGPTARIVRSQ
jgi:PAS domain-containing protein